MAALAASLNLPQVHNHALDAVGNRPRHTMPRPTKELSYELANHSKAFLENGQYANGYAFLSSILAAGTSVSVPAKPHVGLVAPAVQLALASTLVVYPLMTTKAKTADAIKGSDTALHYLHCVQQTIDSPAYKLVRKAFSFPDERTRRRAPAQSRGAASPSPGPMGDTERLDLSAANAQSLWFRAEDFWHIIGWAFNCSALHEKRWKRWQLWLEVMLGFLEADWAFSIKAARADGADKELVLQESLIWQYIISQNPTNRSTRRRIVRAVLATGSPQSLSHYPEVWYNETLEPKPQNEDQKPATFDFENEKLDEYDEEEDVAMRDAPQRPAKRGRPRKPASPISESNNGPVATSADAVARLGGKSAIQLRQRFVALLAQVAQELPKSFSTLDDLFDVITEELKEFPAVMLSVFISTSQLPGSAQTALNANLLLPLTVGRMPNYTNALPDQSEFESILLPVRGATQSFAANAKICLILEQMFMYMMDMRLLEPTSALRAAVESGIEARQKVYGASKGKKGNTEEEELGKHLIETASDRLLGLLEVLEVSAGKGLGSRKEQKKSLHFLSSFGSSLSSAPESEAGNED